MSVRWFHLTTLLVAVCALFAPAAFADEPAGVPDGIAIDDFESYTDEYGQRMYETWVDGWTNGTRSLIGFTDTGDHPNTVHSGIQSMLLEYNNVDPPYYSEVYRTWEVAQDWTIDNVADLSLWFRGQPSNVPAPLYVMVEDSARTSAVITHPDPQVVLAGDWAEWRIALSALARGGMNLNSVKKMSIGVGDRNRRQSDGRGWVFIDDIRLFRRARAADPYPADGDVNVPQSLALRWSPGSMAAHHDIYFGTDPNAVASATPAIAGIYRSRQARDQTTFNPGPLDWNTTYYWRIDEANDANPESPWKGPVWSLTAADFLIIDDFESYDEQQDTGTRVYETWIDVWVDGCELQFGGCPPALASRERQIIHGGRQAMALDYNNVPAPWLSAVERDWWWEQQKSVDLTTKGADTLVLFVRGLAANDPAPLYVTIEDSTHKVSTMVHPNPQLTLATEWIEWRIPLSIMTDVDLTRVRKMCIGVGNPEEPVPGGCGRIYLDDIRVIKSVPPPQKRATVVYPPDGASDTPLRVPLQWLAGHEARQHDVYLGDDAETVASATPASAGVYQGRQASREVLFNAGPLDFNRIYYWRIDEVNDTHPESPVKGEVWHFTTADFLIIDDFESYTGTERGNYLYEAWIDGCLSDGIEERILLDVFLEHAVVHGGKQSMAMDYNNLYHPWCSENEREFAPVYDWTVRGFDTLVLYVRGRASNAPEPLYVVVEDHAGKTGVVVHADPQVLLATEWREWRIPLSSVVGVNLRKVEHLYIGVGDRRNPTPGGAGIVYIDDIRVIKSGP